MTKEIEEIKQLILGKYDLEKADDLIDLYNLITKYGMGIVQETYPEKLFQRNLKSLKEIGLFGNDEQPLPDAITKAVHKVSTLNLDWLRYFIVYASIGNTTEASRHLNISSQALIQAISGIESYLKLELVERKKHFKGLTLTGKLFYHKALKILNDVHDLDNYFEDLRNQPLTGEITVGWGNLWADHILPDAVSKFLAKYPKVYPKLFLMDNFEIEKWLLSGEIDIGLMNSAPEREEFDFICGNVIPMVIVCKAGTNPTKDSPYIAPGTFNSMDENLYPGSYKNLTDIFPNNKKIVKLDSMQLCLSLCERGLGMVILPEIVVRQKVEQGLLKIVEKLDDSTKRLHIIWNKKIHIDKATRMFIKELRDELLAYVPII